MRRGKICDYDKGGRLIMDKEYQELIEVMRLKIVTLEVRLNALEAWRDNDDTYKMEQNERR